MIRLMLAAAIVLGMFALPASEAGAQQVSIVALGASNTYGKGRGQHSRRRRARSRLPRAASGNAEGERRTMRG